MSRITLEKRVATLEAQLAELQAEVRTGKSGHKKDWRNTIGAFTDDEGMRQILQDAMQLREESRNKRRAKPMSKRKVSP